MDPRHTPDLVDLSGSQVVGRAGFLSYLEYSSPWEEVSRLPTRSLSSDETQKKNTTHSLLLLALNPRLNG